MGRGFLRVCFALESEGVCTLFAEAAADGFAGRASGLFNTANVKQFARAISEYPLPPRDKCSLSTGFGSLSADAIEQEHLGIEVYPTDTRGHIGIQVRMATLVWPETRVDAQKSTKLELRTTYEPIRRFAHDLLALIEDTIDEALIEEEPVP